MNKQTTHEERIDYIIENGIVDQYRLLASKVNKAMEHSYSHDASVAKEQREYVRSRVSELIVMTNN